MKTKLTYSIPWWSYQIGAPEGSPRSVAPLKDIGVTAIEIPPDDSILAIKQAGLGVSSLMAPSLTRGLNRVEHHAELIPIIEQRIAMAQKNGIPFVLVFSGDRAGQDDAAGIRNCATAMRALAPAASRAGVTQLLEMLNGIDHKDYQADRSGYGFAVARAVDSQAVQVLYDIYHMHRMGEDILRDFREHLDAIKHVHVAASPKRDAPKPGGEIDYAHLVPAIHELGYRGSWGLEWIPTGDPIVEARETINWFESLV
jgi:hydroxypyruvate isomerase